MLLPCDHTRQCQGHDIEGFHHEEPWITPEIQGLGKGKGRYEYQGSTLNAFFIRDFHSLAVARVERQADGPAQERWEHYECNWI